MTFKHLDVLILGAGLSGIDAACQLKRTLPNKSFEVLESRDSIGGTWDLFKYPGIRSDSDMSTMGYNFKPWKDSRMLADGPSIKRYVIEAAEENGVIPHIRFGHKVQAMEWKGEEGYWTVTSQNLRNGEVEVRTSKFVICAMGYYDYEEGYSPEFKGERDFNGQVLHPQFWPETLKYQNKKMVVIGSGATAVTLVPSLLQGGASKVVMVQRSPTYVASVPGEDPAWKTFSKVLPSNMVYKIFRARNVVRQRVIYAAALRWPEYVKNVLLGRITKELGGKVDMKHFTPSYNPWDQRLCAVPDGDLFKALKSGSADVVTGTIAEFTETGIRLDSGQHISADIIVKATGLKLKALGGVDIRVDGKTMEIHQHMMFKGMMLDQVPNFLTITGYYNASWTLKADIVIEHFLRIVSHMDRIGAKSVRAMATADVKEGEPFHFKVSAGYVQRGAKSYPKQGAEKPWLALSNYMQDAIDLKFGSVTNPFLRYEKMLAVKPNSNPTVPKPKKVASTV